ncbi:PP2C family protein-serine/threonine phosphatase [Iamia sp.]|uniref:PP2C family protein-serine/threonine phosphatase n=1 Tax=Iamia sp. TaxID=2722710 RepID=UPI002C5313D6|nr:protein phosphatase 2C domain-containing protein [Iamia sp.]HXH58800.1 protein phosphatase 2C domain-containing protein [Iamia sp.]
MDRFRRRFPGRTHPPTPSVGRGEAVAIERGAYLDRGGASATGVRPENQDRWAVGPCWGVVCDGVGGHAGGARAAQLALDAVTSSLAAPDRPVSGADLDTAVEAATRAVRAGQDDDPTVSHMASTLTVASAIAVEPDASVWTVIHVGDSPAWLVTATESRPITCDHNLAGDLARAGSLSTADAAGHPGRRLLTRAIGVDDHAKPDTISVTLAPGDALVLASDGLSDVLDAAAIDEGLSPANSATDGAERLVRMALDRGTTDNVTVVVLRHRA